MKKTFFVLSTIILFTTVLSAQSFQTFVTRVLNAPDTAKTRIVDSFMTANTKLPYFENDTTVYFIYRGNMTSVSVAGDANEWSAYTMTMTKLPSTTLWYMKRNYPSDSRLDYKIVTNGANWILDPKNPYQCSGGYGPNSELRMPGYVPAPEIDYSASIAHGTLKDTTMFSAGLNSSRLIRVYTPPTYSSTNDSFPVVLVHDGIDYLTLGKANNVLDFLIANNRIRPIIAVFVPAVDRTPEYAGGKIVTFSNFIVNEVMAYVDTRFRTMKDPHYRAVMGASYGGNISLYMAANYPHVFGNVAPQSSYIDATLSSGFQNNPKLDLKLYLDIGTYDIGSLIPMVRNFIPILQSKGYDYLYREFHEGHSWGNWRAHMDIALEYFFPGTALEVHEENGPIPTTFELQQNYPNPFNPTTNFRFKISDFGFVSLRIYNVVGQEVATLVNKEFHPGTYTTTWDASGQPSGIYIIRLEQGNEVQVQKMVLMR